MSEKATISMKGFVRVKLVDKNGNVKKEVEKDNLVTDVGRANLASLFNDDGDKPAPVCIAVGESNDDPELGQTDLQGTELARRGFTQKDRTNDEITWQCLFEEDWEGTVEEAGIFNQNQTSGEDPETDSDNRGDMSARFLTGTFEKFSQDSLLLVWGMKIEEKQ